MKPSKRDHRVYLEDILAAIGKIEQYTVGGKSVFLEHEMTQDAVIRQLSIIGEATAKLPAAMKANEPEIPWRSIVGMRNIIIHDYSQIKLQRIWEIVEQDLLPFKKAVDGILHRKNA